ncbi:6833_t:CDS:1 [Dentiscutata erythropus]|uniref:6833_t:CDS:1 n=1 Tax=Dentiscutata erythropus TaxID=1348616 RepID=A0A9N9BLA4_9GLOM|nr:6833_t:CDS:1 [Dentiscutata erythropus]
MDKNLNKKKYQVDNSSDSNGDSNNKPVGCQFTNIWKEIELGEEVSCGVYRGKCIHCSKKFKYAKPVKTRAHIAHECSSCPEHIKQYYNYIIANNLFDDPKVENYEIPHDVYIEIKPSGSNSKRKKLKLAKLTEL